MLRNSDGSIASWGKGGISVSGAYTGSWLPASLSVDLGIEAGVCVGIHDDEGLALHLQPTGSEQGIREYII